MHIEFLLEEPSAEAFLAGFLPRFLRTETTWNLIPFQGKADLLSNLENRLKGYAKWMPEDWRIAVLIDEDRQDCRMLKGRLEDAAQAAGLLTKCRSNGGAFRVVNRIAVEELEAWFLGDVEALRTAFPGVPAHLGSREAFRDPDAVKGGTWEALERVLQKAGHFPGGLRKIELARLMAVHMVPERNRSGSFQCFLAGISGS